MQWGGGEVQDMCSRFNGPLPPLTWYSGRATNWW